jgi:hypothetical protein
MLGNAVEIVVVEAPTVSGQSEHLREEEARIRDAGQPTVSQEFPPPHVLLRPEEVHLVSRERILATPFRNGNIDVGHGRRWLQREHLPVSHGRRERLAAVRAE